MTVADTTAMINERTMEVLPASSAVENLAAINEMLQSRSCRAVGTNAAMKITDFGTSRWQLSLRGYMTSRGVSMSAHRPFETLRFTGKGPMTGAKQTPQPTHRTRWHHSTRGLRNPGVLRPCDRD
jgi:hypothetical protein